MRGTPGPIINSNYTLFHAVISQLLSFACRDKGQCWIFVVSSLRNVCPSGKNAIILRRTKMITTVEMLDIFWLAM